MADLAGRSGMRLTARGCARYHTLRWATRAYYSSSSQSIERIVSLMSYRWLLQSAPRP